MENDLIKNVIFDLGNVLLTFIPKDLLLKFTKNMDRINRFIEKFPNSETWLKMDRGILSMQEARNFFLKKHPEEKDLLIPFFDRWLELFNPIRENIEILKELKENGYKVYALSNFMKEAFEYVYSKFESDIFYLFDGMVISYTVNFIKPEKEIYQILLQRYNLVPIECIFIDDVEKCILGAKKLGIQTILYNFNSDLKSELQKFKIKI